MLSAMETTSEACVVDSDGGGWVAVVSVEVAALVDKTEEEGLMMDG